MLKKEEEKEREREKKKKKQEQTWSHKLYIKKKYRYKIDNKYQKA